MTKHSPPPGIDGELPDDLDRLNEMLNIELRLLQAAERSLAELRSETRFRRLRANEISDKIEAIEWATDDEDIS